MPRRNYKRLYGPAQLTATPTDLYTTPAGTQAVIRKTRVNNPSPEPVDFTMSVQWSFSDDFNRASLGSDWVTAWACSAPGVISANTYKNGTGTDWEGAYYAPAGNFADGELSFAVVSLPASQLIAVKFRGVSSTTGGAPTGSWNGYSINIDTTKWRLVRFQWDGFIETELAVGAAGSAQAGDSFRAVFQGTSIRLYRTRSGSETLVADVIDGVYPTGYVGLEQYDTTGAADDWQVTVSSRHWDAYEIAGNGSPHPSHSILDDHTDHTLAAGEKIQAWFGIGNPTIFPVTALLDDFNRADESPIGGNWTTPIVPGNANAAISGNQVITNNTPPAAPSAYWNPRTFGPDCEVWMRIAADFETSEELILWARLTPGTGHEGYECAVNQNGTIYLGKRVAGVWNDSGLYSYVSPAVGDYLGLRCVGSTIEAWYRPVGTGVWERKTVWTDTTYPDAGYIGFSINTQDFDTAADDFGGGNVSPYAAEVLADGPVAYYRMDEASGQPQDSSGYGNHTTAVLGTPDYAQAGAVLSDPSSTGIAFDGVVVDEGFGIPDYRPYNLFDNAGFEDGDLVVHDASGGEFIGQNYCTVSASTANPRTGTYHMRIALDGLYDDQGAILELNGSGIPVTPNQYYTFECWVYASNGRNMALYLDWKDADLNWTYTSPKSFTGTGAYQYVWVKGRAPADAAYAHPIIRCTDQVTDNVDVDDMSLYLTAPALGDTWSIEAWIKRSTLNDVEQAILAKDDNYGLYVWNDKLAISKPGTAHMYTTDQTLDQGRWYHAVATKNGSTNKLYLDGVEQAITASAGNLTCTDSISYAYIGMESGAGVASAELVIDEIALYPTALSAERIKAHYDAAKPPVIIIDGYEEAV